MPALHLRNKRLDLDRPISRLFFQTEKSMGVAPHQHSPEDILAIKLALPEQLERLKRASREHPMPTLAERRTQLTKLKRALLAHKEQLCTALAQDYGQRSHYDSQIADILPCIMQINYTQKRLKRWMQPHRRHAGLLLAPAKVEVHFQPLGVVGIIVPWNFPVMLSLGPLITAIAAGNRAMLKLSEFTPHTNAVLRTLLTTTFNEDEIAVIEGDAQMAAARSEERRVGKEC